jgi:protein TonB
MFERLVVSTAQKRKGRTARFFVCTSIIYLSAIAFAFAVSILLADPKLADSRGSAIPLAIPPPGPQPPQVVTPSRDSSGAARQDPSNVLRYEDIVNHRENRPPQILLLGGADLSSGGVIGGDPNGPPGGIDIPDANSRGSEPPPRPPDPPKPQPRVTDTRKPLPVSSTVLQGKATERRTPAYPLLARQIHLQGDVAIEVIISPEGRVESARAVSGHPMLVACAVDAARGWRFAPTLLNGIPVRVTGVITFVFKLGDN